MSRERPILFNGAMVRAILSGKKIQTRRVVKGMALDWLSQAQFTPEYVASPGNDLCPFGQPGDRLWVRETWAKDSAGGAVADSIFYAATPTRMRFLHDDMTTWRDDPAPGAWAGRWRPSIHMPRWACRLVLEITAVRVERLQAISAEDAIAEGAMEWAGEQNTPIRDLNTGDERIAFMALWDSTGGSWDSTPWVWVIEFKQVAA